jgi:hypothetical protein
MMLSATTLLVPLACQSNQPETFNQDDGEHEMFKASSSHYPFDRKMTFKLRWSACTWYVDVQDAGGKRRTTQHGTEKKSIYVVFVDGRRAWVVQESCGKVTVHDR